VECHSTHLASLWLDREPRRGERLQQYTCLKSYVRLSLKKRYLWGKALSFV
jgi:hypothetical protein